MSDLGFVRSVLTSLAAAGLPSWLFGGWAEELRGLRPPGPHHDLDLLYPASDFALADAFLASGQVREIDGKRLPHKRAFVRDGTMTELFLVRPVPGGGFATLFWGEAVYHWPDDVLGEAGGLPVASAAALRGYRAAHDRLHRPGRSAWI